MRREERRPTRMVRKGIWASSSTSEAGPGNSTQALLRGFKAEHQRRTCGGGGVGGWGELFIHGCVGQREDGTSKTI